MPRKKHKPEEVSRWNAIGPRDNGERAKLRQVDVAVAQGTPLAEAIRGIGVSEVTYHRWRNAEPLKAPLVRALWRRAG